MASVVLQKAGRKIPGTVPRPKSAEVRSAMDDMWLEAAVAARASDRRRATLSVRWLVRQVATIALVHALILIATLFLLLLGDALFTSYALVLRDAVFVQYVAQLGWLQRMAAEFKGAIAFVVAVSAGLQMLLVTWRAVTE